MSTNSTGSGKRLGRTQAGKGWPCLDLLAEDMRHLRIGPIVVDLRWHLATDVNIGAHCGPWVIILRSLAPRNASDQKANDDLVFGNMVVKNDAVLAVSLFVEIFLDLAANLLPIGNWEVAVNAGVK